MVAIKALSCYNEFEYEIRIIKHFFYVECKQITMIKMT
jgi:hypothetical protein